MVENLRGRMDNGIPRAVEFPISFFNFLSYWGWKRLGSNTLFNLSFREVQEEYEIASINFTYSEISALTDEEFFTLQKRLSETIALAFAQKGDVVPDPIATYLVPGHTKNILIHERDHIKVLPEHLRRNASVDIIIWNDLDGNIGIRGIVNYDQDSATNYESALSLSEPNFLAPLDVFFARMKAQATGNKSFIALIEQRIRTRETH